MRLADSSYTLHFFSGTPSEKVEQAALLIHKANGSNLQVIKTVANQHTDVCDLNQLIGNFKMTPFIPSESASAKTIYLQTFGGLKLQYEDKIIAKPPCGLLASLFIYLLLHPKRQHEQRSLTQLFWPGFGSTAKNNLQQLIFRLRKYLRTEFDIDDLIQFKSGCYSLSSNYIIKSDYTAFHLQTKVALSTTGPKKVKQLISAYRMLIDMPLIGLPKLPWIDKLQASCQRNHERIIQLLERELTHRGMTDALRVLEDESRGLTG
ncbi:MAG: hypothetical protein AAF544_05265 [Bacteroidota bacterium]